VWAKLLNREKVDLEDPAYGVWEGTPQCWHGEIGRLRWKRKRPVCGKSRAERIAGNQAGFKVLADFSKGNAGWNVSGVLPETLQKTVSDFRRYSFRGGVD